MGNTYPLLEKIKDPSDLKNLTELELLSLSKELRSFIIEQASVNPGHLGASLGVVELTIAIHHIFNTPYDQVIWDVGHQAYGHKILTGRKTIFDTNRKYGGISGFPNPQESKYDAFGVGHASTSISAALGLAKAARFKNQHDKKILAVIGDGAMTGGMAFEGLNNAGIEKSDILVILNDNNMAIDPNVGALKEYLLDITTSKTYNKFKNDFWNLLGHLNKLGHNYRKIAQQIENSIKTFLLRQSNLFESMNFRYFGPVDGHDVVFLTKILSDLKDIPGPKLLHVVTQKGKGFKQAEQEQTVWHAPGKFDKTTGEILKIKSDKPIAPKYQDVFGHTLLELAKQNKKIVGVTPAMPTGSSLNIMMKEIPERIFDVGIAEQHAVTFSAGLAIEGMLPFCNIYSSFMQRSYDQVIHDVAIQKLNVIFCLDRGGLVGEDGATHHGVYDLAYMRCIPNMIVSAPLNEEELRNLMYTAQLGNYGPFSIRYPRGRGVMPEWNTTFQKVEIGKGQQIRKGEDIAVLSIGHVGNYVIEASKILTKAYQINIAHYDMRFVKPIDEEILHAVGKNYKAVITIEDGTIIGGFGSAVLEFMSENGYNPVLKRMGVPDRFIEQGTPQELHHECGFDVQGIIEEVKALAKPNILSNA